MINDDINTKPLNSNNQENKPARPDDRGNIQIDCYVRISDPATQKTLVEVRE
jgi:hypothetical protein